MTVVRSAEALGDLEHIGDYIAVDNPSQTRSFVAELIGKGCGLTDMPHALPIVQRCARPSDRDEPRRHRKRVPYRRRGDGAALRRGGYR